jgi:nucleoid-associated protein YgaU
VIPGPDRPAHQTPEPIRPPADAIHYVTARDTLRRIATQYYGSGDYWTTIAAANPGLIGRDGQVRVGDRLVIPDRSSHEAAAALAARLGPSFEAVASEVVVPITTITVQAGDTLSSLASEHLGSADDWRQLMEANADQLDAPELLRAGMSLRLPRGVSAGVSGADAPRVATPAADAASNGRTYTVQTGDNLTRIAARQLGDGGRWRELYEANTAVLSGPDAVVVGQVLRLPE